MDALGAGANVVAFASIALDGVAKLHQAVAAYRDGPQDVEHLIDAVNELQAILRHLWEILQDPSLSMPADFAEALKKSLKSCEKNLLDFTARLRKCETWSRDGTLQWLIGRLRPVMYQTDFEKMRLTALRHLANFSVQIGIINGFRAGAISRAIQTVNGRLQQLQADRITDMQATSSLVALTSSGLSQAVEANLARLPDRLNQQLQGLRQHFDQRFDSVSHCSGRLSPASGGHAASSLCASFIGMNVPAATTASIPLQGQHAHPMQIAHLVRQLLSGYDLNSAILRGTTRQQLLPGLKALMRSILEQHCTRGYPFPQLSQLADIVHLAECAADVKFVAEDTQAILRLNGNPGTSHVIETDTGDFAYWSRRVYTTDQGDTHGTGLDVVVSLHTNVDGQQMKIFASFSEDVFEHCTVRTHPVLRVSRMLTPCPPTRSSYFPNDMQTVHQIFYLDGAAVCNKAVGESGLPEVFTHAVQKSLLSGSRRLGFNVADARKHACHLACGDAARSLVSNGPFFNGFGQARKARSTPQVGVFDDF